jgi:formiminoglutamase
MPLKVYFQQDNSMRITNLISAQTSEVSKLIAQRKGETKSGSLMAFPPAEDSYYRDNLYRFVVLGIPEDIGPRANKGRGGSWSMWNEFPQNF